MDVGNQASALHLIAYLVVDDDAPYATEPSRGWNLPPIPSAKLMKDPARFRSPAAADIVSWRDRLAIRRQSQLGEILTWDETTDFCEAADTAVSGDLLLRYVAAIASDEGGAAAVRGLAGREGPPHEKIGRALVDARRRGFTGRYPQLLLGEQFWLPFERNTIIEEPDWQDRAVRIEYPSCRGNPRVEGDDRGGRSPRHSMDLGGREARRHTGRRLASGRDDGPDLYGRHRATLAVLDRGLIEVGREAGCGKSARPV